MIGPVRRVKFYIESTDNYMSTRQFVIVQKRVKLFLDLFKYSLFWNKLIALSG